MNGVCICISALSTYHLIHSEITKNQLIVTSATIYQTVMDFFFYTEGNELLEVNERS